MFVPHGNYDIRVRGTVLYIDALGPWNLEAAQFFAETVRKQVQEHLEPGPWAMLAVIHNEGVYTNESSPIIAELHLWRVEHGMRHVAIVNGPDSVTSVLTKYQFDSFYKQTPEECESRYFSTLGDAETWLIEQGYVIDKL